MDMASSILTMVLILAVTIVVTVSFYFLLRRCFPHLSDTASSSGVGDSRRIFSRQVLPASSSVTRSRDGSSSAAAECTVCLSSLGPEDQLRRLPLCCHAFHALCVDTWLRSNQTCPVCRSPVFASEAEILEKLGGDGGSFRIEASSGRTSWLREYVDRLSTSFSSRAASFRSSGRFFTGSSRRSNVISDGGEYDMEAGRVGEEITEIFRWVSGV